VKQERFSKNFRNSQINLSEAWEPFFKNNKAHRAQKDISEALEQIPRLKKFKWRIWDILTKYNHFGSLNKGVYSKDSRLWSNSKESKNSKQTRRSKQDTYHVTNKNIVSSKIPIVVGIKRGCYSGASPSFDTWIFLKFYLGVPWASPSLGSCHSIFRHP
jgi:hypothetical protein